MWIRISDYGYLITALLIFLAYVFLRVTFRKVVGCSFRIVQVILEKLYALNTVLYVIVGVEK